MHLSTMFLPKCVLCFVAHNLLYKRCSNIQVWKCDGKVGIWGKLGERGIRTPGTSQYNGFQDRRNRPLCHLSRHCVRAFFWKAVQRYNFDLKWQKFYAVILLNHLKYFIILHFSFCIRRLQLLQNRLMAE